MAMFVFVRIVGLMRRRKRGYTPARKHNALIPFLSLTEAHARAKTNVVQSSNHAIPASASALSLLFPLFVSCYVEFCLRIGVFLTVVVAVDEVEGDPFELITRGMGTEIFRSGGEGMERWLG